MYIAYKCMAPLLMRNSAYGPDAIDIVRSQICYVVRYICIGMVGLVIESMLMLE